MSILVPMTPTAYDHYLSFAIPDYAASNVAAGRWLKEESLERSRAAYAKMLPQGLQTPDNHLYEIKDEQGARTVGILWYSVMERDGIRCAFVCEIHIYPEFRRQGHARRAMQELERIARAQGLTNIKLHVFGYNRQAQALYTHLGYSVIDLNMVKQLG